MTIIVIIPLWKVHQKAGQNPAISVVTVIPLLGGLISMGVLAFGTWNVTTKGG